MKAFRVRPATLREIAALGDFLRWPLQADAQGLSAEDTAGRVRGMVVFDGFKDGGAHAHQGGVPIAFRTLAPAGFQLAFNTLGLSVLRGLVRGHNGRALALALHWGFRETQRVRDGWAPGEDAVHLELLREECRWLNNPARKVA